MSFSLKKKKNERKGEERKRRSVFCELEVDQKMY